MARHVEGGELPGLVSIVARRGNVHVDTIGTLAVGGDTPMRRDTIFRISSMTKPVTAVATLVLVEEGKLRLDDPVDDLLPELADRRVLRSLTSALDDTVPAHRPITAYDLLTFTFGHGGLFAMPGEYPIVDALTELGLAIGPPQPGHAVEPDEWMRRLGSVPLVHQPGAEWMYNTGSQVLGVLVARAAGQPFEDFLRERIFEPLGMRDTSFSVPSDEIHRLPVEYATDPVTGTVGVFDEALGQWSAPPVFPDGAAGLVSTVDDFLAFATMLLHGGTANGERILSRPAVETMTTDQLTPQQKAATTPFVPGFFDSHGWGFGVSVVTRRTTISDTVGKYGWDGGLGTCWANDPAEEMITILMTQQAWASPTPPAICRDFWTAAYQAIDD
jgi:CubicO group peptidase (beta-lactamase class C family)